ncbi:MAG: retroviral-like aspartic protease, partial [Mycoplasma sp.]|nr:retroviral-like aspartic protease [Mycoplasma sp.]
MNIAGRNSDSMDSDRTLGPGSRTPGQPGSRLRIRRKLILSTPVNFKMAGAIHLPADRMSAGINSVKSDSRIFCSIQIRPLDLPQRRETSLRFLIDSGVEVSALSAQDYVNSVKKLTKLSPTKIQLYNFDNSKLKKPKGQVNLRISVGGEWINGNFQVLSSSCQSVLGAPELKALKLLIDMGTGTLTP